MLPGNSLNHRMRRATAWNAEQPGEQIADSVLMSRSNSNSYLVASDDGDVSINTGTTYQGSRVRERFEELLGRSLDVRKIVFTQHHDDQMGGWNSFNGPGVETIAQRNFPYTRLDWTLLRDTVIRRATPMFGTTVGAENIKRRVFETPEPEVTTFFSEAYAFGVGGRPFELFAAPGGESISGLFVWLPQDRIVFTGNFTGALWGQLPHLSTPRGDRMRSARLFIEGADLLLGLEPELLVTGHDDPIRGADRIQAELGKIRDATVYIHDRTVEGMNAGKSMWELMAEIELPPELEQAPESRGPTSWLVRSIWEEYVGWFRQESVTELYEIPPSSVWADVVELAGGPDRLADRAREHVSQGRPVEALHLTDMVLSIEPEHEAAAAVKTDALEELLKRTNGDPWDLVRWLEAELAGETP